MFLSGITFSRNDPTLQPPTISEKSAKNRLVQLLVFLDRTNNPRSEFAMNEIRPLIIRGCISIFV